MTLIWDFVFGQVVSKRKLAERNECEPRQTNNVRNIWARPIELVMWIITDIFSPS